MFNENTEGIHAVIGGGDDIIILPGEYAGGELEDSGVQICQVLHYIWAQATTSTTSKGM